jgi:heptaprenylglyceryl phosphate synthase
VKEVVEAGADIIVTGNVLEERDGKEKIRELVKSMKRV